MSDHPLAVFLSKLAVPVAELSDNEQMAFMYYPSDQPGWAAQITLSIATSQINVHSGEQTDARETIEHLLLQDNFAELLMDVCLEDVPLSYSWPRTHRRPDKKNPGSFFLYTDDIVEIAVTRSQIQSLTIPNIATSRKPSSETIAPQSGASTARRRAPLAAMLDENLKTELNHYFRSGSTWSQRKQFGELPPPPKLQPFYQLTDGERGVGFVNHLLDTYENALQKADAVMGKMLATKQELLLNVARPVRLAVKSLTSIGNVFRRNNNNKDPKPS